MRSKTERDSLPHVRMRLAIRAVLLATAWTVSGSAQVAPPAAETIAVGDWQVAPIAELRTRGEYRHDLDDRDRGLLVERARLGLDALRGPVEARLVLQDTRALDLAAGPDVPVGGPMPTAVTGAYEAWVEAHTGSAHPSFVRLGRQSVVWGEGRLLGVADWSPTGRSIDAVRGRLVVGDGDFELLASVLTDPSTGASLQTYGELFGARSEWAFDPLLALEVYALARIAQANPHNPDTSLDRSVDGQTYTGSLRLHGDEYGWTWGAEGAYQLGRVEVLAADRSAWAAAGHVAHTFDRVLLLPTVRVGISYASGDDGKSTYRAFDPLLPDVHTWHGAMDLFAWSNEIEGSARVAIAPWTDAVAAIEYRYARLAQSAGAWRTGYLVTVGSAPGNDQAELGHEIDAAITWSPWVPVEIGAGYSAFILGSGARAILTANQIGKVQADGTLMGPNVSHYGYAQVTVRMP